MSYNRRRYEMLRRLGIEHLPTIHITASHEEPYPHFGADLPVRTMPVPGRRCPNCAAKGSTVWVIPGKKCPQCGTLVN